MEVWKDVVGYEGLYQISSYGEVRSLDKIINLPNGGTYIKFGKTRKKREDKNGYWTITLRRDGIPKTLKVHRLVAMAFLDNPNCFSQVNHKDEDKKNNYFKNLEWCDANYNNKYGTRGKRISASRMGVGKGKKLSDETKRKMSEAHKNILGRPVSAETRLKISESLKRYNRNERISRIYKQPDCESDK